MTENGYACNSVAAAPDTPVDRVIRVFGWPKACEIAGLTPAALAKWKRPLRTKGGGGLVPSRLQAKYLREAERAGLPLSASDLIAEPIQ